MAGDKFFDTLSLVSAIDMSGGVRGTGVPYKAVTWGGNIAGVGSGSPGLLVEGAKSGQQITVGWHGEGKYVAAAAIAAGAPLAVTTSGYLTNPASGDYVVGHNAEIAAGSGDVSRGVFNFATPWQYRPDSYNTDGLHAFATAANLSGAGTNGFAVQISSGDYALAAGFAACVLEVGVTSGNTAHGTVVGRTRVRAGDVIGIGESLAVADSGWFIKANSGSRIVGRALAASAAGNSGGLVAAVVDFAQVRFAVNCNHVSYF